MSQLHPAMLMREYHVGDVVVIENHKNKVVPIGIVTDRDLIMEVVVTELDCRVITVGDIILTSLATAKDSLGMPKVIQLMTSKGLRRLPVVDDGGSLLGIVTLR